MKSRIIVTFEYDITNPKAYLNSDEPSNDPDLLAERVLQTDGNFETVELLLINREFVKAEIHCNGYSRVFHEE